MVEEEPDVEGLSRAPIRVSPVERPCDSDVGDSFVRARVLVDSVTHGNLKGPVPPSSLSGVTGDFSVETRT